MQFSRKKKQILKIRQNNKNAIIKLKCFAYLKTNIKNKN